MSAHVGSRSRKAEDALSNGPVAKKARTDKSKSRDLNKGSLRAAVFTNGIPKKLEAKISSPHKSKSSHAVKDARTAVSTAVGQASKKSTDVVEISSASSSDDEEEEEEEEDDEETAVPTTNGVATSDVDESEDDTGDAHAGVNGATSDSDKENEMNVDQVEATFGELIQAGPIDVESALIAANKELPAPLGPHIHSNRLAPITATSLSTVLTQALKTNDKEMLESCFQTNDLDSVRATISRLIPSLIESLLHKIAERLHKKPGRANNLMVWVQWSLVAHGGYLATRKDLVEKLGALNRVIRERANGLQPLLALKGKLDMLSAQLELRREAIEMNRKELDEDDDLVIYVEGEENQQKLLKGGDDVEEDEDEMDFNLDAAAGALDDEEDDSSASEESEDEEVSNEGFSDLDEEVDSDSASDEEDDDESEEEPVQPVKKSKKK